MVSCPSSLVSDQVSVVRSPVVSLLVSVRVLSWIVFVGSKRYDPRNHQTTRKEQLTTDNGQLTASLLPTLTFNTKLNITRILSELDIVAVVRFYRARVTARR